MDVIRCKVSKKRQGCPSLPTTFICYRALQQTIGLVKVLSPCVCSTRFFRSSIYGDTRKSTHIKRNTNRLRHTLGPIIDRVIEIIYAKASAGSVLVIEPFEERIECKDDSFNNRSLTTTIITDKQIDTRREVDVIVLKASKVFKMYMSQHWNILF